MDYLNTLLNLVMPPASLVMLAFAWPSLCFINACEKIYSNFHTEDMQNKVLIITEAFSGIGEQIAYKYAKRRENLVLIARRESILRGISENARLFRANHVTSIAADVMKEDKCKRFIYETINLHG